jgi:8-oxo-dGTP pyrophosphatase MutT (NUDIX family)
MTEPASRPPSALPIPPHAEAVYVGEVFEVLRWQQDLYDGSSRFFEKVRRPDTALVLPVVRRSLLITRQEQPGHAEPFYGLIGGRVDPGETPEDAARRELREEAGLEASSLQLWTSMQPFPKIDWVVYLYVARDCRATAAASHADPGERIRVVEVSLEELLEIVRGDGFRDLGVAVHLLRVAADTHQLREAHQLLFG